MTGTVDNYAVAKITKISGGGTLTQSGTAYTLNLGTLNIWSATQTVALGVLNAAIGQADLLEGSFAIQPPAGAGPLGSSGATSFSGDAAGQVAAGPSIVLNTGTVGTFAETVVLTPTGYNASGYAGILTAQTVSVSGTVVPYVVLTRTPTTISGGPGNGTIIATSGVLYSGDQVAPAGSNTLVAQGAGSFDLRDPAVLSGIQTVDVLGAAAGQSQVVYARAGLDLTVDVLDSANVTVVGAANSTATVLATAAQAAAVAVHGAGGNLDTLQITTAGTVVLNSGDSALTVDLAAGDTLTQPYNTSIAVTGSSDDTLIATDGILRAPQTIAPGGTGNTLLLQGAGLFNLAAPAVLSGIETVSLQGAAAGQSQLVWLRNGLDLTVNLLDSATVTVFGASNNDTINLGAGKAIVYLGSAGETVTGGSGYEVVYVTASTIGASIAGGSSGTNWLQVTGGGTLAMGGNITAMQRVNLDNAGSYDFTANATAGLTVFAGSGNDTVTVGAASQTVFGSTGALTVLATAAEAGARIVTGSGGATLEITNSGTATLNGGDTNLTVKLDASTNLNLGGPGFITANGAAAGHDTITAGGANQTLVSTGGNDTLIGSSKFGDTFLGTSAGLAGDVIKGFGGSDAIDITDIIAGSVHPLAFNPATGGLTVTDGTHSVSLTISGGYTAASFATPVSDGHGGTLIKFG